MVTYLVKLYSLNTEPEIIAKFIPLVELFFSLADIYHFFIPCATHRGNMPLLIGFTINIKDVYRIGAINRHCGNLFKVMEASAAIIDMGELNTLRGVGVVPPSGSFLSFCLGIDM